MNKNITDDNYDEIPVNKNNSYSINDDITNLTIEQHVFNIIDTIKIIYYEIITQKINNLDDFIYIFTKGKRLFYVGLILLMIAAILMALND